MDIFNRILGPILDVFDVQTGQFLGTARFDLSTEGEKKLLNWVNNGAPFNSVRVCNLSFYPAPGYIPPTGIKLPKRRGIFKAFFAMDKMGRGNAVEIQSTFSTKIRSTEYAARLYADSAEFQDIQIESFRSLPT